MNFPPPIQNPQSAIQNPPCPLCTRPLAQCTCGTTPAQAAPKGTRWRHRYGVKYCSDCGFTAFHCRCRPPDAMSQDAARADRDLSQRIKDARKR